MKTKIRYILISGIYLSVSVMVSAQTPIKIVNPGFELNNLNGLEWHEIDGWTGMEGGISTDAYQAPVEGISYAVQKGQGGWVRQETGTLIEAGKTYTLKVWTRSINEPGNTAVTVAESGFFYGDVDITSETENVNAPQLKGAAATYANDDGANVWIDGEYRHQFNEVHMYQPLEDDPITDPWKVVENSGYSRIQRDLGWAVGNVIVGDQKYIYGTRYRDNPENFYSSLKLTRALSTDLPDYEWSDPVTILDHSQTEFPWVLDAHGYFDEATAKLWMAWGGGICYVSEMDPADGMLISHPESTEFDIHPEGTHYAVATWPETRPNWEGDQWSSSWMEGPALYKHMDYWYYLASYGNLGKDYTIRVGRGKSPTGPFLDKQGVDLMEFDPRRNAFGNAMVLGAEGDQLVPGHPHIWEENGKFFMGYDFRRDSGREMDHMGIRKLHWVNDWPTIWIPVEVSFNADKLPEAIGQKLGIQFRNAGEANSVLAVDHISVSVHTTLLDTP